MKDLVKDEKSERNVRKALLVVDSMKPCILFIEEIERAALENLRKEARKNDAGS